MIMDLMIQFFITSTYDFFLLFIFQLGTGGDLFVAFVEWVRLYKSTSRLDNLQSKNRPKK